MGVSIETLGYGCLCCSRRIWPPTMSQYENHSNRDESGGLLLLSLLERSKSRHSFHDSSAVSQSVSSLRWTRGMRFRMYQYEHWKWFERERLRFLPQQYSHVWLAWRRRFFIERHVLCLRWRNRIRYVRFVTTVRSTRVFESITHWYYLHNKFTGTYVILSHTTVL